MNKIILRDKSGLPTVEIDLENHYLTCLRDCSLEYSKDGLWVNELFYKFEGESL